jgi:hypothetical protein
MNQSPFFSQKGLLKDIQDSLAEMFWKDRDGGTSRDDSKEIIPSASYTTTVSLNQIFEWDGHFLYKSVFGG